MRGKRTRADEHDLRIGSLPAQWPVNDPIDGGRLRVWCEAGTPRARQTAFAVGVASFAILLAACDAARDGTTPTAFADALIDLTGTAPAELPRADSFIAMGLDQQGVAALLTDVRGIAITNRGNVWVADRDMAIRVFDRDGNFLRRVGRPGSGPGEFREISWICASGDGNILALDMPNGRVTEFEADGTVAATHNVMPVGLIFDITADRDLLGVPMPAGEMRSEDGTPLGRRPLLSHAAPHDGIHLAGHDRPLRTVPLRR